ISAHEQLRILLNFSPVAASSFYARGFDLQTTDYLKIELQTTFLNDFQRVFVPPTAIAVVSTIQSFSNNSFVQYAVLDGSPSLEPGVNESIIAWTWHYQNLSAGSPQFANFSGEKWVLNS